MKNHRTALILIVVALQCAILGFVCLQREAVVDKGDRVYLRTAPVDPRDLFRGEYVRLGYEISRLPSRIAAAGEVQDVQKPEKRVYLTYRVDAQNLLIPQEISVIKPNGRKFIRGYAERDWDRDTVAVRYGVEKFFMQQGRGLVLERGQSIEGVQIPLEMEVAIGRANGIAVLTGYRFSEMGMGVILPRPAGRTEQPSFKMKVKLVNASLKPLGIVDPEDHSTFRIEISSVPTSESRDKARLKNPPLAPAVYKDSDIKVIPPHSVYEFELDLTLPRYQLARSRRDIDWTDMGYGENARIVYETPCPVKVASLKAAHRLWQGTLTSRSFSGWTFSD